MDFDEYTAQDGPWETIDGWNEQGVFTALKRIIKLHRLHKVSGNVGEIGVHEGQLFCALALLTDQDREKSLAIDVFDDQSRNIDNSGGSTFNIFQRNVARILGNRQDYIRVIKNDSLRIETLIHAMATESIKNEQIVDTINDETSAFRLFSIDGGHTVIHVLNDLRLVERVVVPGGIVIVDDFMNPKWPGVTEGLHLYCTDRSSRLAPFAYGNKKMYLSTFDFAKTYLRDFPDCSANIVRAAARVEMYGRELIWIDFK